MARGGFWCRGPTKRHRYNEGPSPHKIALYSRIHPCFFFCSRGANERENEARFTLSARVSIADQWLFIEGARCVGYHLYAYARITKSAHAGNTLCSVTAIDLNPQRLEKRFIVPRRGTPLNGLPACPGLPAPVDFSSKGFPAAPANQSPRENHRNHHNHHNHHRPYLCCCGCCSTKGEK